MRLFLLAVVLSVGALLIGGCGDDDGGGGGGDGAGGSSTAGMRVAYASPLDPNDIADQFGLEAAKAKVSSLTEDSAVAAALVRGDIDVGNIDYAAAVKARQAGVPISIFYISQTSPEFIMIGKSDIADFSDLKGKTIGYNCPGCTDETFLRNLVKQKAPDIYDSVKWLVLEESPRRASALLANRFDATDLEALSIATVLKEAPDKFHQMAVWSDLEGDAQSVIATVWVAAEKELKANPARFQALATELQKGYDKAYADKDAWLELAKKHLPDVDAELLPGTYDVYKGAKMYPEAGTAPLTPERYQAIERFFLEVEELEEAQSDEMVEYEIINAASGAE